MPLTDVKCRQAKPAEKVYKLPDGGALYLVVKPSGTKLWWYRYKLLDGGRLKENTFSIGTYPEVSLQAAREARDQARELVKQGRHPAHVRQLERHSQSMALASSFEAVTRDWIERRRSSLSDNYQRQIDCVMKADVFPAIGHLPIAEVCFEPALVMAVVEKIDRRGAPTLAVNARQWISQVFRFAMVQGKCKADPAAALKGMIQRPPVHGARPLGEEGIRHLLARLEQYGGHPQTTIAIQLLLYLFLRTAELRKGAWPEVDFKRSLWVVPAEKMKMRRVHMVPLPRQALVLLEQLREINSDDERMFPNTKSRTGVMAATTINRALEYMGYRGAEAVTGHDFRATASTILHEQGYGSVVVEMQLAHAQKNQVARVYNHAQYLEERRAMLQAWADYVDTLRS